MPMPIAPIQAGLFPGTVGALWAPVEAEWVAQSLMAQVLKAQEQSHWVQLHDHCPRPGGGSPWQADGPAGGD